MNDLTPTPRAVIEIALQIIYLNFILRLFYLGIFQSANNCAQMREEFRLMKFNTFSCRSLSLSGVAVAVATDSRFISPRITFYFHLRAFCLFLLSLESSRPPTLLPFVWDARGFERFRSRTESKVLLNVNRLEWASANDGISRNQILPLIRLKFITFNLFSRKKCCTASPACPPGKEPPWRRRRGFNST